ncbi:MAG TPA: phosphatase PAP2 family protein [Nocardioidaceae bacterium]|nr:phosphatase PAP2 family protein [Nocardioidaceae bacterium]
MAAMDVEGSASFAEGQLEEHGRSWQRTLGLVVLAWAVLCGFVVAIGWLLTHPLRGSVGEADDDLALWIADQRTPTLDDVAFAGQLVGDTLAGQIGLVLIAVGFSLWRRSVVPAVFVGLVEAGLLGIYLVAGNLIPRDRPPVKVLDPGLVPDHSFPSGHVATATAIYGTLVVLTWTYTKGRHRWMAALLVLPVVALVARLYQGAHHLSDVLTSLVYAPVWLATVTFLVLWGRAAPGPGLDNRRDEEPATV